MNALEEEFHNAMLDIEEQMKRQRNIKPKYYPRDFLKMVREIGGVATAHKLLSEPGVQSGLTDLWELGLLEFSMEAHVIQEKYKSLFDDKEVAIARRRLEDLGYFK